MGWCNDEEHKAATKNIQSKKTPHFNIDSDFSNKTSLDILKQVLSKFINNGKYSSACLVTSDSRKRKSSPNYSEPADDYTSNKFLTGLLNHVKLSIEKIEDCKTI
jgi:hypothetical protein